MHESAFRDGEILPESLASVHGNASRMGYAEVARGILVGLVRVMDQNKSDPEYGKDEAEHGFAPDSF